MNKRFHFIVLSFLVALAPVTNARADFMQSFQTSVNSLWQRCSTTVSQNFGASAFFAGVAGLIIHRLWANRNARPAVTDTLAAAPGEDARDSASPAASATGTRPKLVRWLSGSQLEEVRHFDAEFEADLQRLIDFVSKQVEAVVAAIERRNDASAAASAAATLNESALEGSAFEAIDGLEFMEIIGVLERMIGTLQIPTEPSIREQAVAQIDQLIIRLEEANSSLAHIQTLIADKSVSLFDRIADNSDLRKVNIEMHRLYEFIFLDSVNRASLTAEELIAHYDNVFIPSCGEDDDKKMSARQVRFVIGNTMGKRIYDAWLSDFLAGEKGELGQLAMMRISPREAEEFGIGIASIAQKSSRLIACLANLKQLRARLAE